MFATAVGIALMCQSLPTEAMHDIWNPAAGLFPFPAADLPRLVARLRRAPPAADHRARRELRHADASDVRRAHCDGAHGGLRQVCSIRSLARRRAHSAGQEPPPPRIWPWALAALVVAAACWTEPAIDQIENSPGNLADDRAHRRAPRAEARRDGRLARGGPLGRGPPVVAVRADDASGSARRTFARTPSSARDRLDDRAPRGAGAGGADRRRHAAAGTSPPRP